MPANRAHPASHGLWRTTAILLRTDGYLLAAVSSLIIFSAMDLLVVYLPLYATERGIPAATVGVLLSIRAVASMLSRFFFGWLVARIGRGRLLVLAVVTSGVAIALLSFTTAPVLMGVLLFAAGLGLGVGAPLTLAWVSEIAPAGMRGSALSLRLAINRIAQAAMPVAMGALFAGAGAAAIIWAMSATLLATGAVSARYFSRPAGTGGRAPD
jgi:MFS family permease